MSFDSTRRFGKDARVEGYNAGNAKGRLNISQAVGLSARLKVNWKKVLWCKAKVSVTVAKVLVNSNIIVVLNRSKEPNIRLNKGNYLAATMLFNVRVLLSLLANHLCLCTLTKKKSFLTDIRNCIWLAVVGANQGC